jgi:hypothetical protein
MFRTTGRTTDSGCMSTQRIELHHTVVANSETPAEQTTGYARAGPLARTCRRCHNYSSGVLGIWNLLDALRMRLANRCRAMSG